MGKPSVALFFAAYLLAAECSFAVELVASSPAANSQDVELTASFNLRFSEPINPKTLGAIRLFEAGPRRKAIPIRRSTDLTNASITIVPVAFLEPSVDYLVVGSKELRAADGTPEEPFEIRFSTSAEGLRGGRESEFVATTFDRNRSVTTILFGPDRRLYAASAFGEIACWEVDLQGLPMQRRRLFQDPRQSRQYIDLEWDPAATADNLLLWVSYAERLMEKDDPRYYFSGEIARLKIEAGKIVERQVVVSGLPHGREVQGGHETLPHQPNGLCFRGGKLYQSVGSTSSSGGPANWGISEQQYSACILEIDYLDITNTVDLKGGIASPFVRRFATGVRNALEIVSHSNGRLYTAVNINDRGSRSDGVPDDPNIPGDQNALVTSVTPDHESLLILERGRHYGFPNPSLGNYVLAGGNPTPQVDPFEIIDYPVGTLPEPGFAPELMFPLWKWGGTSPDGMLEYLPGFDHPLKHSLLCCFYSANDIAWMPLGEDGMPTEVNKLRSPSGKLNFAGPLDITQDPSTGSLYVADFGLQSLFGEDGSLVWLKPALLGGAEVAP